MIKTKKLKMINIDKNFDEAIQRAREIYFEGKIFIYPTDTIYGFGANPFNEDAVQLVDNIKGRELGKMYILIVNDIENLLKYVEINNESHFDFLISIWPNPVSVILNLNAATKKILNRETVAFRIPHHRFCLKLVSEIGMPVISTSVNRSKQFPMIEPGAIKDEFSSEVEAIFYSEKKSYFQASTLIDLSGNEPELIREGRIKFNDVLKKYNLN